MRTETYKDTKKITARRKAQFMRESRKAETKKDVFELANELTAETIAKVTLEGTARDLRNAMYACGLACWKMEQTNTVSEWMLGYIHWKMVIADKLNDTGAIGDAIETMIHLLAMREAWRTQKRNLHVSVIGATDVQINGIRFEAGHNAKLWNDSTLDDAMAGPFEGVIYGMIDPETLHDILIEARKNLISGITMLANRLYVFEDKNVYFEVMQNDLGRSETLKYREDLDKIVTVYNWSKQKAWIERMKKKEFPTLTEYMKALGRNDYLK